MPTATCKCGKCSVTQRINGGMVYAKCHCSHCRRWYADDPVTKGQNAHIFIDWCCNIKVSGPTDGKLTCGGCCPADENASKCGICYGGGMKRIKCKECGQPLVLYGLGSGFGLAATNATMFDRDVGTESACKFKTPHMQVFYNSGLKKGITEEERAVTYHDDLPSLLGISFFGAHPKLTLTLTITPS